MRWGLAGGAFAGNRWFLRYDGPLPRSAGNIHHVSLGTLCVVLAYIVSSAGSLCALLSAGRIRASAGTPGELQWLAAAAISLGGVAIWLMHFIAMLGYGLAEEIAFDVGLTAMSAVIAILVTGVGIYVVTRSDRVPLVRLLTAGLLTGLGITAMHYTGMAAMRVQAKVTYDQRITALSAVIAVAAATVALGLATKVRTTWAVTASAAAMGLAVCGMHYTGMAALTLERDPNAQSLGGVDALSFVLPIFLSATLVLFVLLFVLLSGVNEEEIPQPAKRSSVRTSAGHRRMT
jgi:NO-binding membrane sensor protein with MHYT domain